MKRHIIFVDNISGFLDTIKYYKMLHRYKEKTEYLDYKEVDDD